MPEIRTLQQVQEHEIHTMQQVQQGSIHLVGVQTAIIDWEGEKYTGEYTVTPSQETQVLSTHDFVMTQDVVINPIPSNYGLVTWDGNTLTIT